jgi:putative transposase
VSSWHSSQPTKPHVRFDAGHSNTHRIVGWRISRTAQTGFVPDALEQALHERRPLYRGGLVHHSDGTASTSPSTTPSASPKPASSRQSAAVGDSYDNALAESINRLYKAEVIHRRAPWRSLEAVEFATLEWVDWLNHRRLLEPIGNIPPAEAEALSIAGPRTACYWRHNSNQTAYGKPGAIYSSANKPHQRAG